MSYFDYFMRNFGAAENREKCEKDDQEDRPDPPQQANEAQKQDDESIQGTCYTMCPMDEAELRIREKMVHKLETCGDATKLVKVFARSAADSNLAIPKNLRPYNILYATVAYLLFEVTQRNDVSLVVRYDFINDRLRAVRQDMTIQRLSPELCARLLEPMVRFYVYFGYKLHGLPAKDLDPVLHTKNLLECVKWFLKCCDSTVNLQTNWDHPTDRELEDLMTSLNIDHGNNVLAFDQTLIEALYILSDLVSPNPLRRFGDLPRDIKRDFRVKLSSAIAIANRKGNFVLLTRLTTKLCPLGFCVFAQYLPHMQRRAIEVMSSAYSSRQNGIPARTVQHWLSFGSEEETMVACRHYGMQTTEDKLVIFSKAALKTDVPMHPFNIHALKCRKSLDLPQIFTYSK